MTRVKEFSSPTPVEGRLRERHVLCNSGSYLWFRLARILLVIILDISPWVCVCIHLLYLLVWEITLSNECPPWTQEVIDFIFESLLLFIVEVTTKGWNPRWVACPERLRDVRRRRQFTSNELSRASSDSVRTLLFSKDKYSSCSATCTTSCSHLWWNTLVRYLITISSSIRWS